LPQYSPSELAVRERWLEAVMPAFLVAAMTAAAAMNARWITPRSMKLIAVFGFAFCIILALRELWTQREELRLLTELNTNRENLLIANAELQRSERQVRSLNTELEARVAERTKALESAYRELESFSYAVAHDIKAPLRTVNSFGTLLLEKYRSDLDPTARDYIDRMRTGASKTAQLVDDLLAYAQIERTALQRKAISLRELVDACVAEQTDDIERFQAIVKVSVPEISVTADSNALEQALRNLLQNALKFSRNSVPPRVAVSTTCFDQRVRLTVSDNGIGFEMQHAERIFVLFQRLHRADQYPGTGIGLAIARKAIERMGGTLWAESSPGQGAYFHIDLPLHETAASIPARRVSQ
jgi:signal transduction histidine kinase